MESKNAHKAGVAKVIPPKEWIARKAGYNLEDIRMTIPKPVYQNVTGRHDRFQMIVYPQKSMTVQEYVKLAESKRFKTPTNLRCGDLETQYWKTIQYVNPLYGVDVHQTLTDPDLKEWNINELPTILQRVLKAEGTPIQGVDTSYLFFGMWKSQFPWHTEEYDLYSINYVHFGAGKTWYAIPPQYGHKLESLARDLFPDDYRNCKGFMHHKNILFKPSYLQSKSIPFQKITQEAGEIIITFPYAYHSGFNLGLNCAESANFATPRWVEYRKRATTCTCNGALKISMAPFVKLCQEERYESWLAGKDHGLHPEDPKNTAPSTSTAKNFNSCVATKGSQFLSNSLQ